MVRSFNNDFVRADAVHFVVEAVPLPAERALDSQGGKFVGHNAQRPPRSVGRSAIIAIGEHFRWSLALVAVTKGAKAGAADLHLVTDKIRGALGPVGRDNHPPAGDRILTQFWQLNLLRYIARYFRPYLILNASFVSRTWQPASESQSTLTVSKR